MISKALVAGAYHKKLEELARLGVELHLVVPFLWGNQELEIRNGKGYKIYPLRVTFNSRYHFHFYRGLSDIMREVKADIVHIDEEYYNLVTFQSMRLAKTLYGRPLFFTWQNIYKDYPPPFPYIERYNFRWAHAAIAGNNDAKDVLRKKGFNKKIVVMPQFGVDPEIFRRSDPSELKSRLGIKKDQFVIGYIGRLVEEKGVLDLLIAVSRLSIDAILLLVGSGPLRPKILALAKDLGIDSKVKLIDKIPSLDVPKYLACFDSLVLPSLTRSNWKEQFGRVLIEAMACQVPVIGSSSGEIPNVIGDAGIIYREGDTVELAGQLLNVLVDSNKREELGEKGRERVLTRYTQKRIAEETYELYKELMTN